MKPLAAVGIAMLALITFAPACAGKRSAEVTYRDSKMDFSLVQKVAVLPFENLTTANTAWSIRLRTAVVHRDHQRAHRTWHR